MDFLNITISGHVGSKIQGLTRDRFGRSVYRFSLAANFRKGTEAQSCIWFQCNVSEATRDLFSIITERSVVTGEKLLIMADYADLNAVLMNGQARSFLNINCTQIVFVAEAKAEPVQRLLPERQSINVIQFQQLIDKRAG